MKESYDNIKFQSKTLDLIKVCDEITTDYMTQGLTMTVRQVYYQLVARNLIPNTTQSYDNIQELLNKARLCGLIDWDAIEDRTRGFVERPNWNSPKDILEACARSYNEPLWDEQECAVFVVVEKEALAGIMERTCKRYDVPLLPARGYPSVSTLREFARGRIMGARRQIVVLHCGDHDPSGIDMSRDLKERLEMLSRYQCDIHFERIALTMEQIEEVNPPPNPAKQSDARFQQYREKYGDMSWELDALTPTYLDNLLSTNIMRFISDVEVWENTKARIERRRKQLRWLAQDYKDRE